ncbi:V-type ATP synthase subunit I [Bienertia sinuspersici]
MSSVEYEKEELGRNVKMLKERESQLEEQVTELAFENTETLIAIKSATMDKKFMVALVLSWVVFAIANLMKDGWWSTNSGGVG